MPGGTNPTQVSLVLDPRSIDALVERINLAFTDAFTKANKVASAQMAQMAKDISDSVKITTTAANNAGTAFVNLGKKGTAALHPLSAEAVELTRTLKALQAVPGEVIAAINKASTTQRRASVETTNALDNAARLEIANVRNVGIQTNIEGQKAVVVARGVAKSRVLITQGMVRSIILLEKGIGATIQGVAKTAVSAVSRTFSGLAGLFKRDTSGIDAQLRETNAAIARGVKRGNTELTEGVRGSLSKREELLRSSFRTQESIVSRSAIRQEETLAGLRRGTQTGVLGAANRGLNIGSLIGGFAVLQAARSTFGVGSEFVRGLAVLQAQLGLTDEQMKAVDALSIQLGNDITLPGVSALDAAQAIQILTKQFGFLGAGAVDAAEAAAKGTLQLSRATGASAEDAAALIGSAVNVFKVGADQAVDIADLFAGALSKAAGVDFTEFKDSFVQGASVFEQFVGPVESAKDTLLDFNTTLAVLAKNGITGSNAGAALKQFFLQATKQSPKALDASAALAKTAGKTGSVFFDAAGKARQYNDSLTILRAGLVGMTDEQRNATLSTLFGSRSIVAANALVGESQKDYDALRDSIQQQGLAAKIAAAQNTGFRGALDALKSVIETLQIQLFKKLNPALGAATLGFANFLNNILSGKGVWSVVRDGLLGIAAGLGAVLAVKGVVEIFQQLARVMALVATPFGAILTISALLGGAIVILAKHSEAFRDTLRSLRERLEDVAGAAKDRLLTALRNIGDVIVRDVIPFLKELGKWVGEHLVSAFHAVVGFITGTVIPALKTAGEFIGRIASTGFRAVVDFIRDHVIPALQEFARFVVSNVVPVAQRVGEIFVNAFNTAEEAVKGFWHTVEPILRPALEGFKTLGRAIAAIFTGGDFSQLGKGFSAVGSGITTSFSTIGKNLLGVLDRLWETLQAWFKTHFSGPQLISLGKGFLDLVEWIGHTLGSIVTSPTFIKAVALLAAGLAVAAVLVAGRFIEGFGKAFAEHFDELLALLGKIVLAGLTAVFENPLIVAAIGLAIFSIFRLVNIVKAFSAAGQKAGGGFTGGFKAGISGLKNQGNILTSFFGGPDRVARTYAQGVTKAFSKEMTGLQTKLRALGSKTIVAGGTGLPGFIGPTNTAQARAELKLLSKGIDDATLRGLIMRDSFKQVGAGLGSTFKGLGKGIVGSVKGIVQGVGAALNATNVYTGPGTSGAKAFVGAFRDSVRGSGKLIASGFSGIGAAISETAAAQGKSVGAVLGSALAKAAIGAVSVVAGFQAGKAEGASGGSGLLSALLGGVTAGAVIGGPFGVAVGAVTAGAALVGAAMGRAEERTKAFRAEVDRLTSSFTDNLSTALKDGKIDLDNLDFKTAINLGNGKEDFTKALADALSPDQRSLVRQLGLSVNDVFKILEDSGGNKELFKKRFTDQFIAVTQATDEFRNTIGPKADAVAEVLKKILAPGGDKDLTDFLKDGINNLDSETADAIFRNEDFLDSILRTAGGFTTEADAIAKAIQGAKDYKAITEALPTTSPFSQISTLENIVNLTKMRTALREATANAVDFFFAETDLGKSVEDVNAELVKMKLPPIPQNIVDDWNQDLEDIGKTVDGLQAKIDAAPQGIADRIRAALGSNVGGSLRGSVDQTIGDVIGATGSLRGTVDQTIVDSAGIASSIQEAIDKGGVAGAAALRIAIGSEADTIGQLLTQGIIGKQVTDTASAETFLAPIKQALIDGLNPDDPGFQAAKDNITLLFATAVQNLQPTIDAVHAADVAKKFNEQVQQFLTDHPLTTEADAKLLVKLDTDQGFLTEGDARRFGIPQDTKTKILKQLLPSTTEVNDAAAPIGKQIPLGLTKGMKDPEAIAAMKAQVRSLANQALAQFKLTLGIKSPSTEMATIGTFMTQGLADGITAGQDAATTAAAAAAQAAVDAAKGVINGNSIPPITVQSNIISGAARDRVNGPTPGEHSQAPVRSFVPPPGFFPRLGDDPNGAFPAIARQIIPGPEIDRQRSAGRADTIDIGQLVTAIARAGTGAKPKTDVELGALKASHDELTSLITVARGLVTAAEQLNKRGPDVTNVSVFEAKDAKATARAAIAELRADRMLLKGVR